MKRLVLAALLAAALYAPSAAFGADPSTIDCNAYVVDQAGVLVGGMKGEADAAALRLQNVGADPRVVFIDNLGSAGSIDAFEQQLVSRCDSWRSEDGLRKNNLVALIVAMRERKAVVSWGERWNPSLEAEADRIRSDFLNPNLADGRFGVAVEETLDEVGGLIDRQLHPTKPNGKSTSTNLWALWIILFALGGVGVGLGMFFGLKALARARREREEAQQQALGARNAAADAVVKMNDAHDDLQTSAEIAKGLLGPEEAEQLAKAVEQASQRVGAAGEAYSTLGTSASDPDKSHRTDEYQRAASGYRDVVQQAEAATKSVVDAAQLADELIELTKAVPGELERSTQDLASARGRIDAVQRNGYWVDEYAEQLDQAEVHQGEAGKEVEGKRAQKASKAIEAADSLITAAVQGAEGLPARKAKLEADAKALQLRIEQAEKEIEAAKPVFTEISSAYAEESWRPIAGNGSQAEKAVAYTVEALAHARKSSTMETQQWDEAQAALDEGGKALDQAKALTDALVGLKPALEQAKANAKPEIDAAKADIARAAAYEHRYDADIRDEIRGDIHAAGEILDQAKAELDKEKPNYLLVVKLAQQATSSADHVLKECQSEHEQMERLRRQAASAISSAESEIARAESFISTNSLVAGHAAKSSLDSAHSNLSLAKSATDLESQISSAQEAEADAERAYEEAKSNVDRLKAAGGWLLAGSSSSSSYSSSSSSFIGFSSGGSSDFGGGFGGGSSGGFGGGGGGSSSGGW